MLKEVRKALADTISEAMPDVRVLAYPPLEANLPMGGVLAYVQPDPGAYVSAWRTFTTGGRCEVRLQVVCVVADTTNAERDIDRIDDLIDPMSDAANVFAAVVSNPTLGITAFEVNATPLLDDVQAGERVVRTETDQQFSVYEVTLPVMAIVKRS